MRLVPLMLAAVEFGMRFPHGPEALRLLLTDVIEDRSNARSCIARLVQQHDGVRPELHPLQPGIAGRRSRLTTAGVKRR